MKKTLLLVVGAALIGNIGMAQITANSVKAHIPYLNKKGYLFDKKSMQYRNGSEPLSISPSALKTAAPSQIQTSTNITLLGNTYYDLQSNSAVARRILNHGGGKLSVVWTLATANDANYPTRGTGYAFFDGTSWSAAPSVRLESVRTGWPNIGDLTSKEIIISHDPNIYGFQQGTNASEGSSSWSFAASGASHPFSGPDGSIWGRMAISGASKNYVHLISCAGDTSVTCKLAGVRQPIVYARSSDEGANWPIHDVTLQGYDSTMTLRGGADDYAIDARDSTVAIVIGGLGESVTLWKSTNNGNTFTKTYIDSFPYMPSMDLAPNDSTGPTNDGAVTVLVDKNGHVHAAFPYSEVFRADDGTGSGAQATFFRPNFLALIYWNDITNTQKVITVDATLFSALSNGGNGDAVYDIGSATTAGVVSSTVPAASRYGSGSLLGQPSISTDDNGKLYITFSLPLDGDSSADGMSFRDIWVTSSDDNGVTWKDPMNLTCSVDQEEAFASAATLVDANLHIAFQQDPTPGTVLGNYAVGAGTIVQNDIDYMAVPVTKIADGSAACAFNAVPKTKTPQFAISDNYPNPFTKQTSFDISLIHPSDVTLTVSNVLGQTISQKTYPNFGTGKHTIDINGSNLGSGLYFYTVKVGEYSVTKKMILQ